MKKLLLVEDEEHLRRFMLHGVDWGALGIGEARDASDGQEALAVAAGYRPDLLITDIRMPKLSGLELGQALLRENPALRIIFMSAYSDADYLRAALRMGSVDYLFKPVQMEDLTDAVRRAIADQNKMQLIIGSAQLVESYADRLLPPLLTHLLEGDQPLEQLAFQLDMLSVRGAEGWYAAVLLSPVSSLPDGLHDVVRRCLGLEGFAYCRHVPMKSARHALICCFERRPDVEELAERLAAQLQLTDASVRVRVSPVTQTLTSLYGFARASVPAPTAAAQKNRLSMLCGQMQDIIHTRYADRALTAGSIAEALHYTNAYVCTVFKQHYGMTIHHYINVYRIARAKELLNTTELPLSAIAARVGYENDSYFSRVFKKQEGVSPSDYRGRRTP